MNKATVIIDGSKNNCNGTSTNFTYNLSKGIICKKMKLIFAAIPYSSYMITERNNRLKVLFTDGTLYDIYVPYGNYSTTGLAGYLKSQITHASFDMVFNDSIMKYIFSGVQIFKFYDCPNSILNVIGCYDLQSGNNFTSNDLVNFLGDTLFYIRVNNFSNNMIQDDAFNYSFIVPNTVSKNEICFYKNTIDENIINFNEQYIDKLEITIFNTDNIQFDNNG